jgi:hypothetical protein
MVAITGARSRLAASSKCARLLVKTTGQTRPSDQVAQLRTRGLDVYLLGLLLVDRASSVSTITAWTRRPREYWLQ